MAEYIFTIIFLILLAGMIAAGIWQAKTQCKEQRLHSQVIYALYKELKRYNDKTFGEEKNQN